MKLVRNLAAALVLACALSANVYAGDQQTPGIAPPPPPASSPESSTTDKSATTSETDGKVVKSAEEDSLDLLVRTVLALLSVF